MPSCAIAAQWARRLLKKGLLQPTRNIIDRNVLVAMRDGVILYSDIHRLDEKSRHPVILGRLPYDKNSGQGGYVPEFKRTVEAGFVLVVQDTLGVD